MQSIDLDDKTAQALHSLADAKGVTVQAYLQHFVCFPQGAAQDVGNDSNFEADLASLVFKSSVSLPSDFSPKR